MRSRLALKRSADGAENRVEDKRIALPQEHIPVQQHKQQQFSLSQAQTSQHVSTSWASDFVREVESHEALAQQQRPGQQQDEGGAALDDVDELVISDSEEEKDPVTARMPPSVPSSVDEEARRGLLKVAQSMRRRVDEGRMQLLRIEQLRQQKRELVAKGDVVLDQHCAASWTPQQQQQQAGAGGAAGVQVLSLTAECAAGQWWVQATVGLAAQVHAGLQGTSLLAASICVELVCRQQSSVVLEAGCEPDAGQVQLQLTAALDVSQQQQQQQQHHEASLWADVFLLLEQAAKPVALGRTEASTPPVFLGRVQLAWVEWLRSHSVCQPSAIRLPAEPREQHTVVLTVSAQQADLACLRSIVQQQLGCMPIDDAAVAEGGPPVELFALQGPASPAATVNVTLHDSHLAEVRIQAAKAQLLSVMQQHLIAGLQQAARKAGAPSDDVAIGCGQPGPQHAEQAADPADTLVHELEVEIAWVEALLHEKLALDSYMRRHKVAGPTAGDLRERQSAALAAMAVTDDLLIHTLSLHM